MGRPVTDYHVELGHQEMSRLMDLLDEVVESVPEEAEWLAVEPVGNLLSTELGYEDRGEFEDALNGTFAEFLSVLPHAQTKVDEKGREVFRLLPDPPPSEWKPCVLRTTVASTKDLWNVLVKSPNAALAVPSMEFEISADGKRHIDSLYNHIASAVFNLGAWAKADSGSGLSEEARTRVAETILQLNALLNVDEPWEVVVTDPSGLSRFSNTQNVTEEWPEGRPGDRQQQQQRQQEQQEGQHQEAGDTMAG